MGDSADGHDYTLAHAILDQAKSISELEAENQRLKHRVLDMWTDPYTGKSIVERLLATFARKEAKGG